MKQQQQKDVIEEDDEEMDGPFTPSKSSTWDRRKANIMKNTGNIDHNSQKGIQSQALPTQNSVVGEGRGSPSPTGFDAIDGAKLEYPPGLLFTPPRTDPLHRRLANQRKLDNSADVQRNNGPVISNQDWNDVESPLPARLLVAPSRTSSESDKVENSNTGSASEEQPASVKIVVSELNRGDSIANPSPQSQTRSLPISTVAAVSPGKGQDDEPDAGVSSYIARMKVRGHRRSSSAPVPYQPPPMPPTVELKTEGEGGSEASQRREKTVRLTRLQSCFPSCSHVYLVVQLPPIF